LEAQRKKMVILAVAVAAIFGISFNSFWQKNSVSETASFNNPNTKPIIAVQSKTSEPAVIYLSGAVSKPGVYKVASQLRIVDAINNAGGLVTGADVAKVNLAQQVKDGMHIHVPIAGDKLPSSQSSAQASDKININTADKAALEKLPGIGPSLADRILEYRKANGRFEDVSDLKKVSGIGTAKFNQLKEKIAI